MTKIVIEGLSELDEALTEFSKVTAKNTINRALIKAGAPIVSAAKSRAPKLTGKLQMSITSGVKLSRRQKSLHDKISDVEVFVGAGALVQAITQEFGTINYPPQPFLRPAWDAHQGEALSSFKEDLTEEVDKTAQRAARKAARIAAKIK